MQAFHYYHPIEVRYGDLDPQGHVNNAKYLTYLEQARIGYIQQLGLWKPGTFLELGIILADVHLTFRAPLLFGQPVRVGTRVVRLGNKSMTMEHSLEDESGKVMAEGTTVLVAYDYNSGKTIPVPDNWREKIQQFEGLETKHHLPPLEPS